MRKKLLNGDVCLGAWIQTSNTVSAEIMANAGYDWIAVDIEHTEVASNEMANIFRAVSGYEIYPMARVSQNDTIEIRRCLDCGARGIIVPLVCNKADAEKAVAAAKYPPTGVRGFAYVRANKWGVDFDSYVKKANDDTLVIVMIETKEAVDNIDEILSVDGVDGVFIGPYDLSGSYGIPGQTSHEIVEAAKKKVLVACKKHNKAAGQHIVVPTPENVSAAVAEGYTYIGIGMDTVFIADGARRALEMAKLNMRR